MKLLGYYFDSTEKVYKIVEVDYDLDTNESKFIKNERLASSIYRAIFEAEEIARKQLIDVVNSLRKEKK